MLQQPLSLFSSIELCNRKENIQPPGRWLFVANSMFPMVLYLFALLHHLHCRCSCIGKWETHPFEDPVSAMLTMTLGR